MLSDGPTNILPIPRHRAPCGRLFDRGASFREPRCGAPRDAPAFRERAALAHPRGFYQGWDLHPGQLPARYAAVYAFFLQSFDTAAARLKNFVEQAARATLVGEVFDDAATGQGLLNFFLRGINCGAFTEDEAARGRINGGRVALAIFPQDSRPAARPDGLTKLDATIRSASRPRKSMPNASSG